jgi:hypothetical protein
MPCSPPSVLWAATMRCCDRYRSRNCCYKSGTDLTSPVQDLPVSRDSSRHPPRLIGICLSLPLRYDADGAGYRFPFLGRGLSAPFDDCLIVLNQDRAGDHRVPGLRSADARQSSSCCPRLQPKSSRCHALRPQPAPRHCTRNDADKRRP